MDLTVVILKLDDWVLCRIYNKKGTLEKRNIVAAKSPESLEQKPETPTTHDLAPPPSISPASGVYHDMVYFDTSDSVPRPHTDSSCSEYVLSPEITCDREVQSEPTDWWRNALDFPFHYVDATVESALASPFQIHPMSPSQDMFTYVQKPF